MALMMFGCILCFLSGAAAVLAALAFFASQQPAEQESPAPDREQEKLREQWENFLSYNGTEQGGGYL